MHIEKLAGTEERLYQLVAPLVMKISVLRQNNNYPYKTSVNYVWFVALEEERVLGFVPVEVKDKCAVINNYYIVGDEVSVLTSILQEVIKNFGKEYKLQSVTHTRHIPVFQGNAFAIIRTWKLYVKMVYQSR